MYPEGCGPMTSDLTPEGTSSPMYDSSFQVPRNCRCIELGWSVCADGRQGSANSAITMRRTARFIGISPLHGWVLYSAIRDSYPPKSTEVEAATFSIAFGVAGQPEN